jgi:hypothetical protein
VVQGGRGSFQGINSTKAGLHEINACLNELIIAVRILSRAKLTYPFIRNRLYSSYESGGHWIHEKRR